MRFKMTQKRLVELRRAGAEYEADANGVSGNTPLELFVLPRWEDMRPEEVLAEIASMGAGEDDIDLTAEELEFIRFIPESGLPRTYVKWKWRKLGGHVHVNCFSRTTPSETWALNGTLVFDVREWQNIVSAQNSVFLTTEEDE